jgi:CRP/FNR family transcriptional regulator
MTNSTIASRRTCANLYVAPNLTQADALCPGLAVNSLRILSDHAESDRTVKAGCDLFRPGERNEAIYHLVDGWGALYNLLEDGRRQILQFALPGSALVFISASNATMTYGAQALTDTIVRVISFAKLKRFVQDYPETGLQLAKLIAQDRLLAYDHLSSIGRHSARERVAHLLLELFTRYRIRWPGHRIEEMYLPLTQEHIGDATGLTGVHVNRVLRDLRLDGIVGCLMSNKRAALYVRVSTDSQTVENQIRELRQVAGRRGWDVVEVYSDAGISGAKGRNGRPGLDSMLKDASRRKFDIVMAWSIDRLGRSLIDLLDTIQHLEACGVDLYLDQQAIDTTTPMGKLVFQVTGAFAEFERTMIRQRVKAGLKRAVAQGVKLGRPKIDSTTERKVRKQLAKGVGILRVAKSLGIGTGTVQRIANELR